MAASTAARGETVARRLELGTARYRLRTGGRFDEAGGTLTLLAALTTAFETMTAVAAVKNLKHSGLSPITGLPGRAPESGQFPSHPSIPVLIKYSQPWHSEPGAI
jgi:hypothetical protein